MTAQKHAEEMARRARALIEREKAAGRWFQGRNDTEPVDYPEPRIARGDGVDCPRINAALATVGPLMTLEEAEQWHAQRAEEGDA
ncbi:MAG TPA: hypothetical protein VJO33_12010 [Gemmatimonadaceae bacterium]|nr:hypothetical protein [Gemmatimonadaceae bacterium]